MKKYPTKEDKQVLVELIDQAVNQGLGTAVPALCRVAGMSLQAYLNQTTLYNLGITPLTLLDLPSTIGQWPKFCLENGKSPTPEEWAFIQELAEKLKAARL